MSEVDPEQIQELKDLIEQVERSADEGTDPLVEIPASYLKGLLDDRDRLQEVRDTRRLPSQLMELMSVIDRKEDSEDPSEKIQTLGDVAKQFSKDLSEMSRIIGWQNKKAMEKDAKNEPEKE